MGDFKTSFITADMYFSEIRHHRTKQVLVDGDIKKGAGYCGVLHIWKIKWDGPWPRKAHVNLYVSPFEETSPQAKKTGFTNHRVMMEELQLWEKFEKLKNRACDKQGKRRRDFDDTAENELFYGFTRKDDNWFSTSCTLNSWINPLTKKEAANVVRNAGVRGSDRSSKVDLVNLMPKDLWRKVLPKLEKLTTFDGKQWTYQWATRYRKDLKKEEAKREEQNRMRRLVCRQGSGSSLYDLDLARVDIGRGGLPSVKALATVLQEARSKDNMPRCSDLQRLDLRTNELTDEHIGVLAPVVAKCSNLDWLDLNDNHFGDRGCIALSKHLPSNLKQLYLHENKIGDEGCIALSKNLPRCLWKLVVADNKIGLDGVTELLKLMELPSNHLTQILMRNNPGKVDIGLYIRVWDRKIDALKKRAEKIVGLKQNITNDLLSFAKFGVTERIGLTPSMETFFQTEAENFCSSCCRIQ